MELSTIDARLLSHPGTTKALHEKWGWMVYWVGGRQFACEFIASPDAKPSKRVQREIDGDSFIAGLRDKYGL